MSRKTDDEGDFRLRPRRPRSSRQGEVSAWSTALTTVLRYARTSRRAAKRVGAAGGRGNGCSQRCAVRVMYSRNAAPGLWRAHARYIARESAAGNRIAWNSEGAGNNIGQVLDSWQRAGDPRLWKLIVSPEFGDRTNLDTLTRDLMARLEQDLGTKLQWIAVPHFNTEHPHVHIALRGIRGDGTPLQIGRDLIRSGIRAHAQALCTLQLGFRSGLDVAEAERRDVAARRYTALDRQIAGIGTTGEANGIQPETAYFVFAAGPQFTRRMQLVAARLGVLRSMGLAEELAPNKWHVRRDFGTVLKAMQVAGDRQKTLAGCGAAVSDPRLQIGVLDRRRLTAVEGRVLGHGEEESGVAAGRSYMLLEGTDARIHLIYHTAEMQDARSKGRLKANSFIRLQKQFENGRPILEISDLGDADRIASNKQHLKSRAEALVRRGVMPRNDGWGGWLGRYHAALAREAEDVALDLEQSRTAIELER